MASTDMMLLPAEKRQMQLQEWLKYDKKESAKESSISIKRPTADSTPNSKKRLRFNNNAVFLAACQAGDIAEVTQMLREGQDINCYNSDGLTALHAACIDGNYQMTDFLVRNGANINCKDNEGWTPLHAAAGSDDLKISSYLVGKKAQVDAINCDGDLAIDVTEDQSCFTLLDKALRNKGIATESSKNFKRKQEEDKLYDDAVKLKSMNLPKNESGRLADPNPHLRSKATMVHVAASKGYVKALKLLLEDLQMDMEARDIDGWTPLHAAAHWEEIQSIKLLHKLGANFLAQTKFKQMPIDVVFPEDDDGMSGQNDAYNLVQRYTEEAKARKAEEDKKAKLEKERADRERKEAEQRAKDKVAQEAQREQSSRTAFENSMPNRKAKSEVGLERTSSGKDKIRALQSKFTDEELRRKSTAVMAPRKANESDVARAVKARRERAARRCTQGVTLEAVTDAKKMYNDKKGISDPGSSLSSDQTETELKTPTGYIPASERAQIKEEGSSRAVPRVGESEFARMDTLSPNDAVAPSTSTLQTEQDEQQRLHNQRNLSRQNKRKLRKDINSRQKTGIITAALNDDADSSQKDSSPAQTPQEVPTSTLLSDITAKSSRARSNEPEKATFTTDAVSTLSTDRSRSKRMAEYTKTSDFGDYRTKYEAEKEKREKLEREISDISRRLGAILKTVAPKSRAKQGESAGSISRTVELLEEEIRGQTEEMSQLRMENGALVRVISKMRQPGYH